MIALDFHPANPTRPPSWRWGRALATPGGGRTTRRGDDPWVRRARRFLAALDRRGGDPDDPRLVAADPAIAAAYRLHRGGGPRRAELEARLLAGQGDREVANRIGVDADCVGAYAALFFDVGPHLARSDWVAVAALGPGLIDGAGADDPGLAARLIGYNFGPAALDAWLGLPTPGVGDRDAVVGALRRYLLAALAPIGAGDERRWLGLAARLGVLEREAATESAWAVSGPLLVPAGAPFVGPAADPAADLDHARPVIAPPPLIPPAPLELLIARRSA